MTMKTEKLTVTLPADLKQKVKDLAEKENRNVSNMTAVLIMAGMQERKTA